MIGTDANTGKALAGVAHLRQSVRDILTTPVGSRVMRRDYGSRLFELVDAPLNKSTKMDLFAATAEALALWEPRISLLKVNAEADDTGHVVIDVMGKYLPDGSTVRIDGIVVN